MPVYRVYSWSILHNILVDSTLYYLLHVYIFICVYFNQIITPMATEHMYRYNMYVVNLSVHNSYSHLFQWLSEYANNNMPKSSKISTIYICIEIMEIMVKIEPFTKQKTDGTVYSLSLLRSTQIPIESKPFVTAKNFDETVVFFRSSLARCSQTLMAARNSRNELCNGKSRRVQQRMQTGPKNMQRDCGNQFH